MKKNNKTESAQIPANPELLPKKKPFVTRHLNLSGNGQLPDYLLTLMGTPVSMAIQDKELRFTWAFNQKTIDPAEIIGKTDDDIFTPETASCLKKLKRRVLEKDVEIHEQLWVTSNGKRVFIDLYLRPMHDENGEVNGVGISTIDLTAQKNAENALKESQETVVKNEHMMRHFIETVPVGIIKWGVDGTIYEVNSRFLEITGYTNEDILEKRINWFMLSKEYSERDQEASREYALTGKCYPYEKIIISKNGNPVNILISSVMVDSASRIGIAFLSDVTDRKRMEEALRESEEKFREMIWGMQVGVLLQGPDAEILISNPKSLELLGLTEDQLFGKTSFDPDWNVIHEDGSNFPGSAHPVPLSIATRKPVRDVVMGVFRPSRKDRVWLLVCAEPLVNEDGIVKQVVCTFIDISERKKAEAALRDNQDKYRSLVENIHDIVFTVDLQGLFTYVSPFVINTFGYTAKELVGQPFSSVIFQDDLPRVMERFREMLTGQVHPAEYRIVTKTGDVRWMRSSSQALMVNGQATAIQGLISDITERKQAEGELVRLNEELDNRVKERTAELVKSYADLQRAEVKHRTVADFTYNWEYWINAEGHYNYVSPSCQRISGYSAEEFMNDNDLILKIIHPDDFKNYSDQVATLANSKEPIELEFRIITQDGDVRWIGHSRRNIFDDGKYLGVRVSNRDITEKVKAESDLINLTIEVEERERTRFSSELHDGLGPLLSTIKLYFQWLAETEDPEKIKLITEKGNLSLERAIQTTREVSHGLSPMILNSFGYTEAILDFVSILNDTQKIKIFFTYNSTESFRNLLEITLYRITTELVNNTLHYANASYIEIGFMLLHEKNALVFTYVDDGIGFDIAHTEDISKGLGLMNIRNRIKNMMGTMKIESEPGRGIKVFIELPLTDPGN
ncbi:MAG: PAS domain S-box protein [Bacteroidetes bacterium]|nr:PAS domain S-box protein [Bacteroidota bacterium]